MYRLLVVDDDESYRLATKLFLEEHGYWVDLAATGDEAIEKVRSHRFAYALVILDYRMNGKDGATTARALCAINPDIFILTRSGDNSQQAAINAYEGGSRKFIGKDIGRDLFLEEVRNWCNKYEETHLTVSEPDYQTEIQKLLAASGIVGTSEILAKIGRVIWKIRTSDIEVLLRGENGVGKELFAKAIHATSARKNKPLVTVNCGAIVENLIESELFGHERGSFTSAVNKRPGRFQQADGGTLFLDEIGDASPPLQVKLLRVLQEGTFSPVGSNAELKVDVRVIAATNRNLEQLIREGKFREDLYYRLKSIEIEIPPLRTRREDIEPMVAHFCKTWSKDSGIEKTFLKRTVEKMERYEWPGNGRELAHMVEALLVVSDRFKIAPEDLNPKFFSDDVLPPSDETTLKKKMDQFEKEQIARVYRRSESLREAAAELGISPANLLRKVRKYSLKRGSDA